MSLEHMEGSLGEQVIRDLSDTDTMPLTVVNETMESLPLESRWVAEDVASRRVDDLTPPAEPLPTDVPAP